MENLITTYQNQVVTSSRKVAESFGKEHKHVLRDIDNLKKDVSNFGQMFYKTELPDKYGRPQRAYLINKKGFQLLAMGFTGSKAIQWKLQYIDAFEAMEKELTTPKLTPSPRYRSRAFSTALNDLDKTKQALQKMFKVSDGLAYSKAISMIEPLYGVSFEPIKELLPAAEHQTGYLNATQIGAKIDKSAREVNLLLVGYGFQHKDGKDWRLDDAGREYGEEKPYTQNGHSGYQIKWNEKIVEFLLQQKKA
jgi:Rha family phage regulatory protein